MGGVMEIVPRYITSKKQAADYQKVLESLMAQDPPLKSEKGRLLSHLAVLLVDWEKRTVPLELPSPIDAVRVLMADLDLKQKDLVPIFGSRSRVSGFLRGKRKLSLNNIRKLYKKYQIPLKVLIK